VKRIYLIWKKKYFVIKTTNYDNVIIELIDKKIPESKYNNSNVFFHYVQLTSGNNNPDIVTVKYQTFNQPIYNSDSIYTAKSPIVKKDITIEDIDSQISAIQQEIKKINPYGHTKTYSVTGRPISKLEEEKKSLEQKRSALLFAQNLRKRKYYSFKKGILDKL
jgi:hypothetical protein